MKYHPLSGMLKKKMPKTTESAITHQKGMTHADGALCDGGMMCNGGAMAKGGMVHADDEHDVGSRKEKSLVDEVKETYYMAKGGMIGSDHEPVDAPTDSYLDNEKDETDAPMEDGRETRGMDLEAAPIEEDAAHETSDASLVADILKDRKMRRRG